MFSKNDTIWVGRVSVMDGGKFIKEILIDNVMASDRAAASAVMHITAMEHARGLGLKYPAVRMVNMKYESSRGLLRSALTGLIPPRPSVTDAPGIMGSVPATPALPPAQAKPAAKPTSSTLRTYGLGKPECAVSDLTQFHSAFSPEPVITRAYDTYRQTTNYDDWKDDDWDKWPYY